jgi:putative ABC transport system permease protein
MKLQDVDTGVRGENILTMEVPMDGTGRTTPEQLTLYEQMRSQIAALPGVTEAAVGSNVPLRANQFQLEIKAEGRPVAPNEPTPQAEGRSTSPEYFRAAGIALLSGREFTANDRAGAARVVIINQTLAKILFGDRDPLGQHVAWTGDVLRFIPISGEWRTVVGVVADTRDAGLDLPPRPIMYVPFAQEEIFSGAFVVRTSGDPSAVTSSVIKTIRANDPKALIDRVNTISQVVDERVAPRRVNALLVTSFGALALVIAAVGIAGVLAFSVSARRGEIGIRMSLGADSGRVQRMVLGEGWILLAGGLFLGVAGSLAAARLLERLLFGVTPNDPTTVSAVSILMAVVGTVACWLPAIRAARVQPAEALRSD